VGIAESSVGVMLSAMVAWRSAASCRTAGSRGWDRTGCGRLLCRRPTQRHFRVMPPFHVGGVNAEDLDYRLDRVRGEQGANWNRTRMAAADWEHRAPWRSASACRRRATATQRGRRGWRRESARSPREIRERPRNDTGNREKLRTISTDVTDHTSSVTRDAGR
jgi:hypothetical protein